MDEKPRAPVSPQIKVFLGTALVTALVVSLGWAVAWKDLNRLHRADFEQFERRVAQLDSQLDGQLETMRDLLKEYASSQDARIALESRLAAAENELKGARADVETWESGDWEARFGAEQERADALAGTVTELEQQLAEKDRAGEELAAEAKAAKKLKADLAAARGEIDKLKRQLAQLTSQRPGTAEPGNDSYRQSRLKSLHTALNGRSSGERVPILKSVVPTIPGGVTGGELAELLAGMDSADVRASITALQPQLRQLDADGTAALLKLMQQEDAAAIAELLAAGANPAEQ